VLDAVQLSHCTVVHLQLIDPTAGGSSVTRASPEHRLHITIRILVVV
jgi:hypothetical protein